MRKLKRLLSHRGRTLLLLEINGREMCEAFGRAGRDLESMRKERQMADGDLGVEVEVVSTFQRRDGRVRLHVESAVLVPLGRYRLVPVEGEEETEKESA